MAVIAVFMMVYGIKLCQATWYNTIAEFPVPVGRHHLLADPDRRRYHVAVRHRAPDHRRPAERRRRPAFARGIGGDGHRRPARHAVLLLRHRHADRLCARLRRAGRRLVDRHSARSGDAEDLRRRQQGRDADHSVLRAGRRHHGGRRHGAAAGRLRQRARRPRARARRAVGGQHPRHDVPERHIRLVGRRHVGDRLGDDPADGEESAIRACSRPT